MKLKKIAALCQKRKRYVLYDRPTKSGGTAQWLGDGCAAYPLEGLPYLTEEGLCRMFDLTGKRREKDFVQQIPALEGICWDDTDPGESEAQDAEPCVFYEGRELLPLMTRDGILFLDKKYLSPFGDEEDSIELYQRKTAGGQAYIAVKSGLLIRGVIFPVNAANGKFVNQLGDMLRECRRVVERAKAGPEGGGFQLTWTEEPSGGSEP